MQAYFSSRTRRVACALVVCLLTAVAAGAQDRGPEASGSGAIAPPQSTGQSRLDRRAQEEALLIPEEQSASRGVSAEGPLVSSWDFVRMLFILGAVVGVIYLIFYLLKRGLRRQLPENEIIRLLGTRSLAGNRSLHLVELGKTVFLLGAAEGGITLISEVKEQETLDMLRLESSKVRAAPQGFGQFFQSILRSGKPAGFGIQQGTVEFMKQQRQRLNRL